MENNTFCLACKNSFSVPVKLPFYCLACGRLAFAEVPQIASEHTAIIRCHLLEYLELFGNKRNVTLFPCPHNYSVKGLYVFHEIGIILFVQPKLVSIKHHPHIKRTNIVVVQCVMDVVQILNGNLTELTISYKIVKNHSANVGEILSFFNVGGNYFGFLAGIITFPTNLFKCLE